MKQILTVQTGGIRRLHLTGLELKNRGKIEYRADVGQGLIEHEIVEIFTATCSTRQKLPQIQKKLWKLNG